MDAVITKVNELKGMDNTMARHGLKALLDKANYEAYQVITNMHEKIGRDKSLADYLKDVYPAPITENYKKVYGDPNIAIVQGRFANEMECVVGGGGNITDVLKDFRAKTNIKDKTTSAVGKPTTESVTIGEATQHTGRYARNIQEATYSNVMLDTIDIKWPYANPIFMFEDGYNVSRNLENVDYK